MTNKTTTCKPTISRHKDITFLTVDCSSEHLNNYDNEAQDEYHNPAVSRRTVTDTEQYIRLNFADGHTIDIVSDHLINIESAHLLKINAPQISIGSTTIDIESKNMTITVDTPVVINGDVLVNGTVKANTFIKK